MVTYNHEKYIKEALDSILMQKANFSYEVVIGEDCSTDNTKTIIQEYEKKYPDLIKARYHPENLGSMGRNNFLDTYLRCKGKYIAMLEGDDYWVDSEKLAKQVDFLENNHDYSYCFSNSLIINSNEEQPALFENFIPGTISIIELLQKGWVAPTASLVFLKDSFNPMPEWITIIPNGDYMMQLLSCSNGGKAYGFNEVFVAYRKHAGGLSASVNYHFQSIYIDLNMIQLMKYFDIYTKNKFLKYTNQKRKIHFREIISKSPIYKSASLKSFWGLISLGEFKLAVNLVTERMSKKRDRIINASNQK
jgi:glycosyltransferase involved in cell wall biosynthesis